MQTKLKNHSIDSLFAFLLLLTFLIFTLMLAGMGSAIYRNGAAYLDENYTSRTAIAYVTEKVRQHDQSGGVTLTSAGGLPALAFRDVIEGEPFVTYVYFLDGALRELMIQEERTPDLEMGSRIVSLSSFTLQNADENLSIADGAERKLSAAGGAEGNPADTKPRLLSVTAVSENGNELSALIHISGG